MSESKLFIIGNSGILHNANEFLSKYWLRYKQAETPLDKIKELEAKAKTLEERVCTCAAKDMPFGRCCKSD